MAWFRFDHETPEKVQVLRIAAELKVPRTQVLGALALVWRWFSEQTSAGHVTVTGLSRDSHATVTDMLDGVAELTGFGEALIRVGWLEIVGDVASVPHFERWLGSAHDVRRQREKRNRDTGKGMSRDSHVTVTQLSRPQTQTQTQNQSKTPPEGPPPPPAEPAPGLLPGVDPSKTPKPKKARKPIWKGEPPPELRGARFAEAWELWIRYRAEEKRNPVTQISGDQALGELSSMGEARAIAAIKHTIASGWLGLREPELERKNGHNGYHLDREALEDRAFKREFGIS